MSDSPMVAKARSVMTEASDRIKDAKSQHYHAIRIAEHTKNILDDAKKKHFFSCKSFDEALEQTKMVYLSKEKYFFIAHNTEATRKHQGSSSAWTVEAWDCPKAAQAHIYSLDTESSGLIHKSYIKDILDCSQKFNRYSVLVITPGSGWPRRPGLVGNVWSADRRLPPGDDIIINFDEP